MPFDAAYVYEGLLRYNYFPMVKERRDDIPPVFTTEDFTPKIADELIAHQNERGKNDADPRGGDGYDQIAYRTTRFTNVLRLMHIPHPNPFARLCRCIHDNWPNLRHICDNERSQIKPEYHGGGRVVVMEDYEAIEFGRVIVMEKEQFPDDLMRHLELSTGALYFVDADVSSCFPSLYSHAIPWALVGHELAKQQRNQHGDWFNRLDACQRFIKRSETHGVPVGPATSNLINEIILCRVDEALAENDDYRFIRFIDDYKCYCKSRDIAERFVRDLEEDLNKYLLLLNAKKVEISELPNPHKVGWVSELAIRLPTDDRVTARQIANFLDYAVDLQLKHPNGSVVKYASRSLVRMLNDDNIAVYGKYLLQLAFHYPVVLPILCEAIREFPFTTHVAQLRLLVARHLQFRRSDAVCWSMYLLFLAGHKVRRTLAEQIVASKDCMAMAMLISIGEEEALVCEFVRGLEGHHVYELDQYWILAYELVSRGKLKSKTIDAYLSGTGLDVLRRHDVSFIQQANRQRLVRPPAGIEE